MTGLLQSTFRLQNDDSVFRQMPNISHSIIPSLLKMYITSLPARYSILHIHGRVASDIIIVGHDNYVAPNPEYGGNQWGMKEGVRERIKGAMNDYHKHVHAIIAKHSDYFTSLSDIEFIRSSFNDIDIPYFQKIKDKCFTGMQVDTQLA